MKVFKVFIIFLLISQITISPAYSSTGWAKAKAHTAWVKNGYVKHTKDAVTTAAKVLTGAVAAVITAKAALGAVVASGTATAAQYATAFLALQAAEAAVIGAEVTLNAALVAAAAAAAAAAGFALGTGIYQLGWGSAHLCWDPVCPVVSKLTVAPVYSAITQAEIDLLIPTLLLADMGEKYTKQDFINSETGIIAWNYMSQAVAFFINSYRGAAVSVEGRHTEVLQAVSDMTASLLAIPTLHIQAANALESSYLLPVAALDDINIISANFENVIRGMQKSEITLQSEAGDPQLYAVFAAAKKSIIEAKVVIDQLLLEVSAYYDAEGNPRPLVGNNGIFPSLTRSDYMQFIQDCNSIGKDCLPDSEIIMGTILLDKSNVIFPDYDFFEELAKIDSRSNGSEELMFGSSNSVTLSQILRASGEGLSPNGLWLDIDLEESPLTIAARSEMKPAPINIVVGFIIAFILISFIFMFQKRRKPKH